MGLNSNIFHTGFLTNFFFSFLTSNKTVEEEQAEEEEEEEENNGTNKENAEKKANKNGDIRKLKGEDRNWKFYEYKVRGKEKKREVVPVRAIKSYRKSGSLSPRILKFSARLNWPATYTQYPNRPQTVWAFRRRQKSFAATGNRPFGSVVTTLTELTRHIWSGSRRPKGHKMQLEQVFLCVRTSTIGWFQSGHKAWCIREAEGADTASLDLCLLARGLQKTRMCINC